MMRSIDLNLPGLRTDDYCPVCDAWPRETVPAPRPADQPENLFDFRRCLSCQQVWYDHGDHTPKD